MQGLWFLQGSGGDSLEIVTYSNIILYSFSYMSFFLERFLIKVLMRQYQYKNICHISYFPLGFLKVIFKTYWMSYLLFSHQGFLRRYQGHYASLYFSHWVLGEVIRIWSTDHVIDLQTWRFFSFSRFSRMSLRWDNNLCMSYHFLLFFPLGFKEF